MSEIVKPVEETPVVVPAVEEPKVEIVPETKVEEPVVPAIEATPAAEEVLATSAVEPLAPVVAEAPKEFSGEGVIGYKAPGGFLKKLAGFQKKFFWFGEEAIETKSLSSYLRGEKAEVGNHNAAWSSQTGKGLLYFSKHATEKSTPAGIINLAEVSDITEDGPLEFYFTAHGSKHAFQTTSASDATSWIAALKTKSVEAKESAEGIKTSEGYKKEHESLSKPIVAAAAAVGAGVVAGKKLEAKKEEVKEEAAAKKEEIQEEAAAKKEEIKEEKAEKKTRKDRSVSRKRNSIFGGFGLGSKKEEKIETPVEPAATEDVTPVEPVAAEPTVAAEPAPLDGPAVAAAVVSAPLVTEETAEPARPATNKRNSSLFGNLSSRFASKKSPSEEAPVVPAKETVSPVEPVSAEAPVIPEPEVTEPLSTSVASPATVPTEAVEVPVATEEVKETKPTVKSDKRKSSLPFGFGQKKEKTATSDSETEKPLSPFAKLRQTVKGKSSPKAEKAAVTDEKVAEKPVEAAAVEEIKPTEPVAATEEPKIVSEPVPVASSTPAVSATA